MNNKSIEERKEAIYQLIEKELPENWKERLRDIVNINVKNAIDFCKDEMETEQSIANQLLGVLEPFFVYDKKWNVGDKLIDSDGNMYAIVFDSNCGTVNYKLLSLESGLLLEEKQYSSLGEMKRKLQFWSEMGGMKIERHIAKENENHVSL